jgi:hypothetical protein
MMATPLAMQLKGWCVPQWLKRNRRYLGVAAFGYAVLHTIFYRLDKASLTTVIDELPRLYIWTGWIAFLIFVPLAMTSMGYFVRKMGTWWKWLQRWTYGALQRAAFDEPGGDALRDWIEACPNQDHSALAYQGGAIWRKRLMDDLGDKGSRLVPSTICWAPTAISLAIRKHHHFRAECPHPQEDPV